MKIISLANIQHNNETMPKHIKYNGEDLYFDGVSYYDKEGNNDILDILAMSNSALTHLYDEVEIIEDRCVCIDKEVEKLFEEDKEIEELACDYIVPNCPASENEAYIMSCLLAHEMKINEIINELKKGK